MKKAQHLFEELRKLRSELAKEKSIPPYMVASDKTLHDMCVKIPLTKEEMLTANGMGARKLEQYGEAFLYCIRDITNGDKAAYGAEETNYGASEIPLTERAKKGRKRHSSDRGKWNSRSLLSRRRQSANSWHLSMHCGMKRR